MSIINECWEQGKRVHFIGIGGVMMHSLAIEMKNRGAVVTGTDKNESENTEMLRKLGIPVHIGHDASAVAGADLVVRNAAIKDTSPDMVYAREAGIPVAERPAVLGALMSEYACSVGVAGTHGKSTTSGMITHALLKGGCDPTAFIGAVLPEMGSVYRLGKSDLFVAEACEYCESFLELHPKIAVILNVEADHLDYYSGIDHIIQAFTRYALNTPADGTVVLNGENKNAMTVASRLAGQRKIVTFGVDRGDCHAEKLTFEKGYGRFDLIFQGENKGAIALSVPGRHNVADALAAATAMFTAGIAPNIICEELSSFKGMDRRFNRVGCLPGRNVTVIDDYAHHPDELEATLRTAAGLGYSRVVCLFQPHTFTRTAALLNDFVRVLQGCDLAVITDVYAAREVNVTGVTAGDVARMVKGAVYLPSLADCEAKLPELLQEGDLLVVCGAGDVYKVAYGLCGLKK